MRTCSVCGKEINAGYESDGIWYACENCMEMEIKAGNFRLSDTAYFGMENPYGGYYDELVGDIWMWTDIFYTEWDD